MAARPVARQGDAKDRLVKFFRTAQPLHEWLDVNVGPSTLEQSGRR